MTHIMGVIGSRNWVAHLFDHHFIEVLQALQLRKRADDAAIMKAEGWIQWQKISDRSLFSCTGINFEGIIPFYGITHFRLVTYYEPRFNGNVAQKIDDFSVKFLVKSSPAAAKVETVQVFRSYETWLVGGFKHVLFSIIYGIILPIDKYFSRWLKPPTRWSKKYSEKFWWECLKISTNHDACWFAGIIFQALGKFNNLFEILRLEHRAVRVDWLRMLFGILGSNMIREKFTVGWIQGVSWVRHP